MPLLNNIVRRWMQAALNDTDTLATVVLTGLMAALALIVLM